MPQKPEEPEVTEEPEVPEKPEIAEEPEVPEILFEEIETVYNLDLEKLHEITDEKILSHLAETFPNAATYLDITSDGNGDIFEAIIPLEITPSISKEIYDLLEGVTKDPALIKKYADMFNSDFNKITDPVKYFSGVSGYYKFASEVVLSFLFNEVSVALDEMNGDIQKIKEFQDQEFKSRIMASHARIKEISKFTPEIIEKEEDRDRKLDNLEFLKADVMQQLDQVYLGIISAESKELSKYPEYIDKINDEAILIDYQRVLINMLEEISNLMFVLSEGDLSHDQSFSTYNDYIANANEARVKLSSWHNTHIEKFGIDLVNKKINKSGVSAAISYIPGVFNKDWKKKELDDKVIEKISEQTKQEVFIAEQPRVLFKENVRLIIMNGKVYYMYA